MEGSQFEGAGNSKRLISKLSIPQVQVLQTRTIFYLPLEDLLYQIIVDESALVYL
jgi:hypothetical protein